MHAFLVALSQSGTSDDKSIGLCLALKRPTPGYLYGLNDISLRHILKLQQEIYSVPPHQYAAFVDRSSSQPSQLVHLLVGVIQ
jgi:hypothetical protein